MNKPKHHRRPMKKRNAAIIGLCVALLVTIVIAYLGLNGMWLDNRGLYKLQSWVPTTSIENWPDAIPLGLDLKGGVYVEYEATLPESLADSNFDILLSNTIDIIQRRLSDKGYPEATVVQMGNTGIRVEIPDVTDPNAILDLIGSPAKLEFIDPSGEVFMEGRHLKTAVAGKNPEDSQPIVSFTLTDEGAKIFGDMTAANIGRKLSIVLDGETLMEPTVETAIYGGSGYISGLGTIERAQTIALQIQSGALPLDITQQKVDTISATLGIDALSTSIRAALIGILLVMLIMILYYRLCGVVASWALIVYIITLFFLIAIVPGIQLTLPGIAGVVLGIGMAVDANVIIYERFREEVRNGRPLNHAVRIGFKNAMSAIIDANVTTIIASIVLLFFGTGSVQGFAGTLLLSVIVSMFTAIFVTRFLLTRFIRVFNTTTLYMGKSYTKKEGEVNA